MTTTSLPSGHYAFISFATSTHAPLEICILNEKLETVSNAQHVGIKTVRDQLFLTLATMSPYKPRKIFLDATDLQEYEYYADDMIIREIAADDIIFVDMNKPSMVYFVSEHAKHYKIETEWNRLSYGYLYLYSLDNTICRFVPYKQRLASRTPTRSSSDLTPLAVE